MFDWEVSEADPLGRPIAWAARPAPDTYYAVRRVEVRRLLGRRVLYEPRLWDSGSATWLILTREDNLDAARQACVDDWFAYEEEP